MLVPSERENPTFLTIAAKWFALDLDDTSSCNASSSEGGLLGVLENAWV